MRIKVKNSTTSRRKTNPIKVMPRCSCNDFMFPDPSECHGLPCLFDLITNSSKIYTTPGAVPVHPDSHRPAQQIFLEHEAPGPTVQRLVAIVSHDKIVTFRHCNRLKSVVAALWIHHNGVRAPAQAFRIFYRPASRRIAVQALANPWAVGLLFGRLAVDIQHLLAVSDCISRNTNNALDVVDAFVFRVPEHDDITTPGLAG